MPSTLIRDFDYDIEKQVLTIEFVAGPVYEYLDVPAQLYHQMKSAFAKGIFFNQYIRNKYAFQKKNRP